MWLVATIVRQLAVYLDFVIFDQTAKNGSWRGRDLALREERAEHHRTTAREFMRIGANNLAKIPLAHAECFMPSQENKQLWAELVSKVTLSSETTCFQPEEGFIFD
jgi:hypothetical protein